MCHVCLSVGLSISCHCPWYYVCRSVDQSVCICVVPSQCVKLCHCPWQYVCLFVYLSICLSVPSQCVKLCHCPWTKWCVCVSLIRPVCDSVHLCRSAIFSRIPELNVHLFTEEYLIVSGVCVCVALSVKGMSTSSCVILFFVMFFKRKTCLRLDSPPEEPFHVSRRNVPLEFQGSGWRGSENLREAQRGCCLLQTNFNCDIEAWTVLQMLRFKTTESQLLF